MVSGTFGGQADKDVKAIRKRFKLTQDGIVGPISRNVLIVHETWFRPFTGTLPERRPPARDDRGPRPVRCFRAAGHRVMSRTTHRRTLS
jgi:hypothetical protein